MNIDHEKVAKRVIELSGGKEQLIEESKRKLKMVNDKWNQDIVAIGRILRAHLFVEYFVTECLAAFNPNIKDIQNARLTFAQKLSLIENYSEVTRELSPGIKRLNQIRNRLAHRLETRVTDQDKDSLLSVLSFKYLREALALPNKPSDDNLEVLEDFAKHVGVQLQSLTDTNSLSERFARAISEVMNETQHST